MLTDLVSMRSQLAAGQSSAAAARKPAGGNGAAAKRKGMRAGSGTVMASAAEVDEEKFTKF